MGINLFKPFCIGNLKLQNRFVRSATWDGSAEESGAVTDASIEIYRQLGKGCIGLIVTGFTFVSRSGKAVHGQYGVYNDAMIPGLKRLVEAAHQGGSRIALQIHHAGISAIVDETTLAVSRVTHIEKPHRQMTEYEIESIIDDFAAAAVRAREAGFDAVQLHGAHGYLMSQFLSPLMNMRVDRWGDSLENRCRFHIEVIRRVRKEIGNDFPLLIKFGVRDESARGLTLEDGIQVSRWMIEAGIDAIEVSAGIASLRGAIPLAKPGDPERAVFRERAAALKRSISVPVILVGGIRSPAMAEDIVNSGDADMVSMSRPFIREPGLINRWLQEKTPSTCISCNQCHRELREERGLGCGQERSLTKTS